MSESTRRVLRTALQVLAGLAVAAPVLVAEAGLDPGQLPWLAVILAVAAAVTRVMQVPQVQALLALVRLDTSDGAHEAGREGDRPDAGVARPVVFAVVTVVVAGVLLAVSASASPANRPPLHVGVTSATCTSGVLEVRYETERWGWGSWTAVPDSWGAGVQLHRVPDAPAVAGRWVDAPEPTRRGEGYVAVPAGGLPAWDLVRVVVVDGGTPVTSSGQPAGGCAA